MNLSEIISAIITSGIVITAFELFRDWKNKRKHDVIDNKRTDYEAQKQGLDLVQEFYNKVKEVTNDQNKQLFERLDIIDNTLKEVVEYLDGDFDRWKKQHKKKEKSTK